MAINVEQTKKYYKDIKQDANSGSSDYAFR